MIAIGRKIKGCVTSTPTQEHQSTKGSTFPHSQNSTKRNTLPTAPKVVLNFSKKKIMVSKYQCPFSF